MKIAELRAKSPEELKEMVLSLKKEQFNLRMQRATGALENQGRFREVRRTIAQAKTLLNAPAQAEVKPRIRKEKTEEKAAAPRKAPAKKAKKEKE
ncbi:MAG: 50S ribosomal protein L29 [Pseudomonadota bacterium]|nr:50S ribosomal protein L29 [Pseudomonadota bacterium]